MSAQLFGRNGIGADMQSGKTFGVKLVKNVEHSLVILHHKLGFKIGIARNRIDGLVFFEPVYHVSCNRIDTFIGHDRVGA